LEGEPALRLLGLTALLQLHQAAEVVLHDCCFSVLGGGLGEVLVDHHAEVLQIALELGGGIGLPHGLRLNLDLLERGVAVLELSHFHE
jgi:hypothetical protein